MDVEEINVQNIEIYCFYHMILLNITINLAKTLEHSKVLFSNVNNFELRFQLERLI